MISVKITKPIYIRKGPGTNFEPLGTVNPTGNVLQMDGWVQGESLKGNFNWFYKVNDNGGKQYYWSGGIGVVETDAALAPLKAPTVPAVPAAVMDGSPFMTRVNDFLSDATQATYHNGSSNPSDWRVSWGHVDLGIWKIWKTQQLTGKGIRIAVIDTGVLFDKNDLNTAGKIDLINSVNILTGGTDIADIDPADNIFHGTRSAGLIGADGGFVNTVYGVAPGAELIIYKIMNDSNGNDFIPGNLPIAIKKAVAANAQVISISQSSADVDGEMTAVLDLCRQKGIFVMAAAGDGSGPMLRFPACLPTVFSIGAYQLVNNLSQYFNTMSFSNDNMAFICPGGNVLTTGITAQTALHQYTSAATAFASGVMALLLEQAAKNGRPFTPDRLTELLPQCCIQTNGGSAKNPQQGFGILYPQKLLALL